MADMEINVRLLREAVDRDLGHRCPLFDPNCLTCRTHEALDGLVASIHELEQTVTTLEIDRNALAMELRQLKMWNETFGQAMGIIGDAFAKMNENRPAISDRAAG